MQLMSVAMVGGLLLRRSQKCPRNGNSLLLAASGPVAEVCRPGEVLEGLDEIPMKEGVVPSPEAVETPVSAKPATMPEEPAVVHEPVPVPEVVAVSAPPSACTSAKQEVRRSVRNRRAPVYLDSYVPK